MVCLTMLISGEGAGVVNASGKSVQDRPGATLTIPEVKHAHSGQVSGLTTLVPHLSFPACASGWSKRSAIRGFGRLPWRVRAGFGPASLFGPSHF